MRRADKARGKLSAEEKAARLAAWEPEPLCAPVDPNHPALRPRMVSGRVGKRITVDGQDCLNLASLNFLGLLDERNGEAKAVECINKYGVGSCGPRGFYGTNGGFAILKKTSFRIFLRSFDCIFCLDVHLKLEERLAEFMQCEEAAVYAFGFAALASAIPSYCKRGDLVFV